MILKQYYLGCLAHASYLLGDEATSSAIVVDPQRDIQQYLADAERLGLQIRHVFLTHFHADFVAGHLELRDRCGATIHLGARAQAEYAFVAMKDGDRLEFPGLRLQVIAIAAFLPYPKLSEMVADQWRKIGIQADVSEMERGLGFAKQTNNEIPK